MSLKMNNEFGYPNEKDFSDPFAQCFSHVKLEDLICDALEVDSKFLLSYMTFVLDTEQCLFFIHYKKLAAVNSGFDSSKK